MIRHYSCPECWLHNSRTVQHRSVGKR